MAFQFADGETQLGSGAQLVEQKDRKSVRSEDVGHTLGEHPRIVARIVADRHADPLAREILFQVVGKPLRGHAHRIDVHAVGTHAHDAAQAARTEFQILVKALGQLLPIVIHQIAHLLFGRFVVVAVEPFLRFRQDQLL